MLLNNDAEGNRQQNIVTMMTSSSGNIFRVTGPLCGEFTGDRWIPHKGQWRGALMFSLIFAWINGWVNNRVGGDLTRHIHHYNVIVMIFCDVYAYNNNLHWHRAVGMVSFQITTYSTDCSTDCRSNIKGNIKESFCLPFARWMRLVMQK